LPQVTLGASLVSCHAVDLTAEPYKLSDFAFEDRGDNACGCPAEPPCKVVTSHIAPPEPLQ
jgi:hypothetical protein